MDRSAAVPKLIVIKGLSADTYYITSSSVSIGRALSNDFQVTAEGVSRSHARIIRIEDEYYISDLGSTNGTFLNGQRISDEKMLKHTDTIEFGRAVTFRFDRPEIPADPSVLSDLVNISNEVNPAISSYIAPDEEDDSSRFLDTGEVPADLGFLRRAYQRLAILYEVNSSVSSITDLEKLLEKIANIVLNLKKADRVAVLLLEQESGRLTPAVIREKDSGSPGRQFQVSGTIVEKTISEGVGILSGDALSDPRFNQADSIEVQNVRSVICAPLKRKDNVIGVIYVDCLLFSESFDEEDLRLLIAICNEASIVIENAYSYREIENLNKSLEGKVRQRTAELEHALEDLKNAQLQLVQSEKMAAIGQLVAGVAHEINNPINYIVNGIESLARYVGELRQMNAKYAESAKNAGANMAAIEDLGRELNFPAHMELLDEILAAISEGANRTAEIVEGLRSFSRTGEAEIKEIDINDTLDKSLILLSHRLKGRVKVSREKGEIPLLRCYASQMGQVFLNLLNNAQQAIGEQGTITLKTWCDGRNVCVSVSDTGKGIPHDLIAGIFDPFFTTKPEGKGIGLGLSISLGIVEKHGGKIDVTSEPGAGTTFTVILPRAGMPSDGAAAG